MKAGNCHLNQTESVFAPPVPPKLKPVHVIFGSEIPSEVIRISARGDLNPEQEERKHTSRICCLVSCSLAGPHLVTSEIRA